MRARMASWRSVAEAYAVEAARLHVGDPRREQAVSRLLETTCYMVVDGPAYRLPSGKRAATATTAVAAWLRHARRQAS